jgi:hypothetical protein
MLFFYFHFYPSRTNPSHESLTKIFLPTQHLDREGNDRYTAEGHGSGRGLCARTVRNVYGVYKPCLLFVQHAERLLPGNLGRSGLQLFLDSFVRNRFMIYLQVRRREGNDTYQPRCAISQHEPHVCRW